MTREELEAELLKIHDYDMSLYDMWKAVHLGIRYGFEKARETKDTGEYMNDLPIVVNKYETADDIIDELDKETPNKLGEQDDKR